jgi:hypothetical protein
MAYNLKRIKKRLGLPNWLNNCKPADEIEPESPLSIPSHGPYPFDSRHAASSFVTVSCPVRNANPDKSVR